MRIYIEIPHVILLIACAFLKKKNIVPFELRFYFFLLSNWLHYRRCARAGCVWLKAEQHTRGYITEILIGLMGLIRQYMYIEKVRAGGWSVARIYSRTKRKIMRKLYAAIVLKFREEDAASILAIEIKFSNEELCSDFYGRLLNGIFFFL